MFIQDHRDSLAMLGISENKLITKYLVLIAVLLHRVQRALSYLADR